MDKNENISKPQRKALNAPQRKLTFLKRKKNIKALNEWKKSRQPIQKISRK